MFIRTAKTTDSNDMAELFMRVCQVSLSPYLPEGFLKRFDFEIQKAKYAERAVDPNWIQIVAVENGKVIGFVAAKDNDAEPLSYRKQIRSMYVDPDWQRQNIGSLLFEVLTDMLKLQGPVSMMLWCIKANTVACSFYEKHGGKRIENVAPPLEYSEMPHVIYAWGG